MLTKRTPTDLSPFIVVVHPAQRCRWCTHCTVHGENSHLGTPHEDNYQVSYLQSCLPLACQKYWKIRTDFTTLLLHNYNSKSDCEDYRKN
jgi:hypothetical protein